MHRVILRESRDIGTYGKCTQKGINCGGKGRIGYGNIRNISTRTCRRNKGQLSKL